MKKTSAASSTGKWVEVNVAGLKITIKDNFTAELAMRLAVASTAAEHAVAIQVAKDTEIFVPALTGSFASRTQVLGGEIIYFGPYAHFLYAGKVMVDPNTQSTFAPKGGTKVVTDRNLVFTQTVHPQAQAHWFEASKAENMEKWERVASKAVTNGINK